MLISSINFNKNRYNMTQKAETHTGIMHCSHINSMSFGVANALKSSSLLKISFGSVYPVDINDLKAVIDKFGVVVEGEIYRGSFPYKDGAIEALANNGIKTVIDLRKGMEIPTQYLDKLNEKRITYMNVGFDADEVSDRQRIDQCLKAISDSGKPVFIHCQAGKDRTGIIVGFYRLIKQKWPVQSIISEAKEFGIDNPEALEKELNKNKAIPVQRD